MLFGHTPRATNPRTGGHQPEHWQAAVLLNLNPDGCLSEVPGTPCALQSATWCWRSFCCSFLFVAVVLYLVVFVSAGVFAPACWSVTENGRRRVTVVSTRPSHSVIVVFQGVQSEELCTLLVVSIETVGKDSDGEDVSVGHLIEILVSLAGCTGPRGEIDRLRCILCGLKETRRQPAAGGSRQRFSRFPSNGPS